VSEGLLVWGGGGKSRSEKEKTRRANKGCFVQGESLFGVDVVLKLELYRSSLEERYWHSDGTGVEE